MDYFENIVKKIIEEDGYWVQQSVKVNLSKEEKKLIGKHTIPRPEIDLVGYKPSKNELLIVEAKSYMDSIGVDYQEIDTAYDIPDGRYKLFTCENYRNIVFNKLIAEYVNKGLVCKNPTIVFGLAVGKIKNKTEDDLQALFIKRNWKLYTPTRIANSILKLSDLAYENDPYVIASKLISRTKNNNK